MKVKRIVSAVLALMLALTVLLVSGCSTPSVAATIDGVDYTTGEYLAHLYNVSYTTIYSSNLYYYAYYGLDMWAQSFPYGEGDDAETLKLSDYIVRMTQDNMVRLAAADNLLEKFGLTLDQEKIDEVNAEVDAIDESALLNLGIGREAYRKMVLATELTEETLLYGLYDEGGSRAMSDEEIRTYFDDNYLSYKIIEMSLVDNEGAALADDEQAKIKEQLEGYKSLFDTYTATESASTAFDKVIEKYKLDTAPKTEPTTAEGSPEPEEDLDVAAAPSTAPVATEPATEPATKEETPVDANRVDIDANLAGDEDLANAVKSVEIGKATVVTYKKNGTTDTMALILRIDPEEGKGETYFADCRKDIIYGAKFDEYNEMVKDEMKNIDYTFSKSAVRMCRPENFFEEN